MVSTATRTPATHLTVLAQAGKSLGKPLGEMRCEMMPGKAITEAGIITGERGMRGEVRGGLGLNHSTPTLG